jgi:hypothetical protein
MNTMLKFKYYGLHVMSRIILKAKPLKACDMIKYKNFPRTLDTLMNIRSGKNTDIKSVSQ